MPSLNITNKQESVQLLEEMGEKENKLCPKCYSILLKKDGKHITKFKAKRQYFRCLECDKRFIIKDKFYHSKTPAYIAKYVLRISKTFSSLSNYKIARIIREGLNYPITKKGVGMIIERFRKCQSQ